MLTAEYLGKLAGKCFIEKTKEGISNVACAGCPMGTYCSDALKQVPELVQSVRDAAHNFNN